MKKVLLSLSILAASLAANAQFVIWDATSGTGFAGEGTAFIFSPGVNSFTVDTASAAPFNISIAGVAPSNCNPGGVSGCYYINGFGNGSYSEAGVAQAFGYSATNFATDKFFMNVKTTGVKVKVQFTSFTAGVADADIYGYEFDLSADAGTSMLTKSVNMSNFSKLVSDNPNNTDFLTSAIASRIGKIEIVFVKTANSGAGAASAVFGNMSIGASQITATKAANISSSVVFPNPASDAVYANLNLKSASDVTVIVTDLMGRQVATKAFGRVSEINNAEIFNAASLAKGMYSVTYVLDGTPAKSDLVVVK